MENNTEVKFDTNEILDISNQVIRQIIEEVEINKRFFVTERKIQRNHSKRSEKRYVKIIVTN